MVNDRFSWYWLWVLTLGLVVIPLAARDVRAGEPDIKHVLVLNSYHKGYPWSDNIMRGVEDTFTKSDLKIEPYFRFMDMKRITNADYPEKLKELYRISYNNIRFDAILVCDNDALDFMRKYRDELSPGVPVVFCGINDYTEAMLDGRKDLTGVIENTSYKETLESALNILPAAKKIVVISDETTTGRAHRSAVQKIQPEFRNRVDFTYLSMENYTWDEMGHKLQSLSGDSIVLLLQHNKDKTGLEYSSDTGVSFLTQHSPVPCFCVIDTRIGPGTLGGKVVSGYRQGVVAAEMVVKILKGAQPRDIPVVTTGANQYIFDYKVMQRFNISQSSLPPGSSIINMPVSLFIQYHDQVLFAIVLFIVLCLLVVFLVFEVFRRRQVEEALQESEEKHRAVIETTDTGFVAVDEHGLVLNANLNYARLAGYSSVGEIIGRSVTEWTASYDLERNRTEVSKCFEKGSVRNLEIDYQRADGTVIPIEINANMIQTKNTKIVVALCRDITSRKLAERKILEYQKRLKLLASQLAIVEEEERKRIAGEIHDEISQTLAIAKMQLEIFQNEPPSEQSSDAIKEIISSISKVIEETRTLIFELSNPTLNELGFEAAVGEWLNETIQQKHRIAAEFFDDGRPKPLDDDLKMMLFRGVRELLTNCVKHAKAGKISVGIRRIDDSIEITVEDNGVGFDTAQVKTRAGKKHTFGLFSIRENMENMGGRFEIESKPGAGCKAVMAAPLQNPNNVKEA